MIQRAEQRRPRQRNRQKTGAQNDGPQANRRPLAQWQAANEAEENGANQAK
jgi:hypothetical protein